MLALNPSVVTDGNLAAARTSAPDRSDLGVPLVRDVANPSDTSAPWTGSAGARVCAMVVAAAAHAPPDPGQRGRTPPPELEGDFVPISTVRCRRTGEATRTERVLVASSNARPGRSTSGAVRSRSSVKPMAAGNSGRPSGTGEPSDSRGGRSGRCRQSDTLGMSSTGGTRPPRRRTRSAAMTAADLSAASTPRRGARGRAPVVRSRERRARAKVALGVTSAISRRQRFVDRGSSAADARPPRASAESVSARACSERPR